MTEDGLVARNPCKHWMEIMPIRPSRDVPAQPTVWLTYWRVLEMDRGTRHFIGRSVEHNIARVSSPIFSFDLVTRTGKTSSGREYKLLGPPGLDEVVVYVWEHYIWRFASAKDVSEEYFLPAAPWQ